MFDNEFYIIRKKVYKNLFYAFCYNFGKKAKTTQSDGNI